MNYKIAFFDAKKYDKETFNRLNKNYDILYFEDKLSVETVRLAEGMDAVCVFVNDEVNEEVVRKLVQYGIKVLLLRCAGYNNVDIKACYGKIHVLRVPAYSPYAIAEHAMALLLTLNRKIHKAYLRTRDFNFNITDLTGFDLYGKTAGIIGTGKIGQKFINICRGFGMNVIAYDLYPNPNLDVKYVSLEEIYRQSDIISLHCPLTAETRHIINKKAFAIMKPNAYIINTSRGGLIDSKALLDALQTKKIKGAGLDVYEEESDLFFNDNSAKIILDEVLSLLISLPNVIITSHQGYLTEEALLNIAFVTLQNLDDFFNNKELVNEICYKCKDERSSSCFKNKNTKCWK